MITTTARLRRLDEVAKKEGREEGLAELKAALGGGAAKRPARRGKTAKKSSKKKKHKSWWDTATPAQKAARVKKMLARRGLKAKQ